MMERRRRDDKIGLREGMARLSAFLDQQPPFEHDVFGHGQNDTPRTSAAPCVRASRSIRRGTGVGDEFVIAEWGSRHALDVGWLADYQVSDRRRSHHQSS
jgi:hypothetical protein